jgi:uncharacterized protein (DUF924 family)
MTTLDPRAQEVLEYWFGPSDAPEYGQLRMQWFRGSESVDAELRARFGELHALAARGELDDWQHTALGALALLLVLDQLSRNLCRGTADAFACDPKALALAERAIERGFDAEVLPVQRWFFYLPFEHAEDLAAQQRAVALFTALPDDPSRKIGLDYAIEHRDVIAKFGRFPHRNAVLGRVSTPAEIAWLEAGGARFG